jgi:alpha-2-macroglobulin
MKKWYFLLFLPVLSLLSGCKAKESDNYPHSPFHNAISAFTSGEISAASSIMVEFARPVEAAVTGESAASGLLVVTPSVRGKAVWAGDRTLVFRPDNNLPAGTRFRVEVGLPELMPDEKEPFFFTFRTITQDSWLVKESIGPESPEEYESYSVVVRLMLADVAAEEDVRGNVNVRYDGNTVTPGFTRVDGRNYFIELAGIARGDEQRNLQVDIKKGKLIKDEPRSLAITVPGENEFSILSARMESTPRKVITVTFSDPLDQGQDMSGLFRLADADLSWSVDNNRVMLYPGESLRGEHMLRVLPEIRNSRGNTLVAPGEFTFSFSSENPEVEIIGNGTVMPYSDGLYLPFRAVSLNAVRVRIIKIYEHNIGHFLQANTPGGSQELKRAGRLVHRQRISIDNDPTLDLGKWNTFSLDLSEFIQPDPGAIYRVELGFERSDVNYPCAGMPSGENDDSGSDTPFGEMYSNEVLYPFGEAYANEESDPSFYGGTHTGDDHFVDSDPARADGDFWDSPDMYYSDFPYYYPPGWSWQERNNPCSPSYYSRERWVSRNILASNLGIMVKGGNDGNYVVTVNDLRTAEPIGGTGVEIFNLQLVKIGEGSTGRDGVAEIVADGTPFLLVAKMDRQRGYLRMDEGRVRPVDRFDVSGETVRKGLKGFVFGERGVWRPGDSLFISFMPLVDRQGSLPPNHPVGFELLDPRGRLVDRQVLTHSDNRLYTFRTKTGEDAVTGFWMARVTMGGVVFNRQLRIETIRPNRLKVDLDIPGQVLWSGTRALFGIDSEWLHGSPASGLRTDVRLNVSHRETSFDGFSGFIFDDPVRDIDSPEIMVFEGRLDERGETSFESVVPEFSQAPGFLSAKFTTRVFEEGGAFSVSSSAAGISPFAFYAGIRSPAGDDQGRLVTETDHRFEVVSADSDGNAAGNRVLDFTVYKMEWRWWWEKAEEDIGRYISSGVNNFVDKGSVTTGQSGEASFVFRVDEPDWGRYLVRVVDRESGHATGNIVMVDWPGWAREAGDADGASLLAFGTDKREYTVGEDITVTFPSMGQGRARVSLETGSTVLRSWWVEPRDETTSFTLKATGEMTPNIYISVTLIQPHSQTANNRPVRLHGVVPAMVTNPGTRLDPLIETYDTWRPDEPAVIKVSEAANREMDYVVAVVDEGLLGLTNYGTPDPWNRFNAREALGVKTWDIYNEVIGAFGGKIEQLFSVGGDSELLDAGEQNQMRRFEPMVRFLGPYRLDRRDENSHTINIPSYTGAVRVMVIATDGEATGSTDAGVRIRKPLMVWSSMPRVMSPEERLSVPVTVFVSENNIRDVTVSLEGSHHYEIVGESRQTVRFDGPGEKNVLFEWRQSV